MKNTNAPHGPLLNSSWRGTFNLPLLCLAIFTASAFAICAYYYHSIAPTKEKILRTHIGVDEITLVKSGFPEKGRPLPVMGLVYEIRSGYSRIVLNGETHHRAGVGATFVRKGSEPTRFLIQETLHSKNGLFGPTAYELLRIIDTQDGSVIATKEWRCFDDCDVSADDDLKGQYSQAARFVRKVLVPLADESSSKYPNAVATAKAVDPSSSRTRSQLNDRAAECPKSISVSLRRDTNRFAVSTADWSFITREGIQQASCLPIGILTMSGQYSGLFFDLISYDGKSLGQFSWQGPQGVVLHRTGSTQHLSNAQLSNGMIQLRVLYYSDRYPKNDEASVGNMEYHIEIPLTQGH